MATPALTISPEIFMYEPVPSVVSPGESTTIAGILSIASSGDANKDGIIDMRDITAAILAFRKSAGEPGYDPNLDVDKNGIIDMRDIVALILRFRQTAGNKPIIIYASSDGVNWSEIARLTTAPHGAFSTSYTVPPTTPPSTLYFMAYFPGGIY
jgi:hypothetical protein